MKERKCVSWSGDITYVDKYITLMALQTNFADLQQKLIKTVWLARGLDPLPINQVITRS